MVGKVNIQKETCELCGREVPLTKHHSTPKQKKGKKGEAIYLCGPCHKQVHALFTNSELKKLNTVEKLKEDGESEKMDRLGSEKESERCEISWEWRIS